MKSAKTKKTLSAEQRGKLLATLQTRFEKNPGRHKGIAWAKVQARLEAQAEKLWSLAEMENTGGEPDVVGQDARTGEFVFFDVIYEDGSQRSNRRVPAELLGGLDKDAPARGFIIEQDREIAEKSGRSPLAIKSITRVGAKPEKMMRVK